MKFDSSLFCKCDVTMASLEHEDDVFMSEAQFF